jgi:hypothetical protein
LSVFLFLSNFTLYSPDLFVLFMLTGSHICTVHVVSFEVNKSSNVKISKKRKYWSHSSIL